MDIYTKKVYSNLLDKLMKNMPMDFIDIEHYDGVSFDKDGYFYTVDFEDSECICEQGNSYMLLTIYKVDNFSRYCPYRIDVFVEDDIEKFVWIDQTRRQRILLFSYNFKTEKVIKGDTDLESLTISKLINQSL